jgi:hypothetical protein
VRGLQMCCFLGTLLAIGLHVFFHIRSKSEANYYRAVLGIIIQYRYVKKERNSRFLTLSTIYLLCGSHSNLTADSRVKSPNLVLIMVMSLNFTSTYELWTV